MMLNNRLAKDAKDHILYIATNNLNGQPVSAKGTVKMYKLTAPENVLRPRSWPAPDYAGFSKSEFKKQYPHDAFTNEHDASTWEKGAMVWQSDFDTGTSNELPLGAIKKWASGKYILELETKDKFGQEVKDVLQTTLFGENDKVLADNQLFQIKTDKDSYYAGDNVKITLFSNAENINITVNIEKNRAVLETKIIRLNKNAKSFTVPVNKKDLGGFAISYSYSVYNYFDSGVLNIQVPYPNTDLQIETTTFRDKLQPGTEETWSFKIKGPKGDKVAAELLASMYDASLDEFRSHYWRFNPLVQPTYYSYRRINAYRCFAQSAFTTKQDNESYSYSNPSFDSFNWFGFYFGNALRGRGYARGAMRMKSSSAPSPMGESMDLMEMESVAGAPMEADMALGTEPKAKSHSTEREQNKNTEPETDNIQIRKNLQETLGEPEGASFQVDSMGNTQVSWRLQIPEGIQAVQYTVTAKAGDFSDGEQNLLPVLTNRMLVTETLPMWVRGNQTILRTTILEFKRCLSNGPIQMHWLAIWRKTKN